MGGNEAGAQEIAWEGMKLARRQIAWEGMKLALSWRSAVTRRVIGLLCVFAFTRRVIGLLWCFAIMRCWREGA
tara:strand:+ start:278 stop:496 length:219 start_codon:yes stop_codon:yes gene_type:complete